MNRYAFQLGVVVILIACGCGPKPAPANAPEMRKSSPAPLPPPVAVASHTDTQAAAPVIHAPPPHGGPGTPTPAVAITNAAPRAQATTAEYLDAMNEAVGAFGREQKRLPNSMKELLDNKYIRSIPPAPPGKKFDYNPTKHVVELVSS